MRQQGKEAYREGLKKEIIRENSLDGVSIQNNQTQSTEEINTLFDALMQKAFNGEMTV